MSNIYNRVAFHTLGCKVNFSETATISRDFINAGFDVVGFDNDADIYVLNTCTVTNNADRKARKYIRQINNKYDNPIVVLIGCYAQLKPDETLKIPGVDLVVGINQKYELPKIINEYINSNIISYKGSNINNFNLSYSINERTRAYLKIQDGCSYNCSYCTIPLARGYSRSGEIDEIIRACEQISDMGIKEIVISGINVGDYKTKNKETLIDLIKLLDNIEQVKRYRISSIEPNLLSLDIINFISESEKFMPHFHIPLQSGSDVILKKMKRKYDLEDYKNLISTIHKIIPNSSIGADVMVGFPGETNTLFLDSFNFINKLELSYLHVFPYSERDNTLAKEEKNQVPYKERASRSRILQNLSFQMKETFYNKNDNSVSNVLIDSFDGNFYYGYTDNYIRVRIPSNKNLKNSMIRTVISDYDEGFMFGRNL